MDIQEIGRRIKALQAMPDCDRVSAFISTSTPTPQAYVSWCPIGGGLAGALLGHGDTWDEAFADIEPKVNAYAAKARTAIAKRMALAMIEITYDSGHCLDIDLRQRRFSQADIADLAETAAQIANGMAGGPFRVTFTGTDAEAA